MQTIKVQNPNYFNMIIGHTPSRQTLDSIHNTLRNEYPEIKFGIAFNQSDDPTQINYVGTDESLTELAKTNASNMLIGQIFFLFTEHDGVLDVMRVLKDVPEIDKIYCATQNQIEIIVVVRDEQRDIMGLVGDYSSTMPRSDFRN